MIEITIHGIKATVRDYSWECDDPTILKLLNTLKDPMGPFGSDPDPDYTLAANAAKRFNAKITYHEVPDHVPGRVY